MLRHANKFMHHGMPTMAREETAPRSLTNGSPPLLLDSLSTNQGAHTNSTPGPDTGYGT